MRERGREREREGERDCGERGEIEEFNLGSGSMHTDESNLVVASL